MQVNWNALPRFTAPRRFGWRVWFLPLFLWPLMLDLPIEILTGDGDGVMAAALGLGLSWIAASRLARGQAGDNRRGAILMGVAAGLTAKLGADMGPLLAVGLGAGAYLGTRLLTEDLPEAPEPVRPPEPSVAAPDPLAGPRAQLDRIATLAPALPHPTLLAEAAASMQAVVDDLAQRPARLPEARRFLAIQLDGLSRIVDRLEEGAAPPPTLPSLLSELSRSAQRLRAELRAPDSEALDIQVKVLAERLKQEGP
ncbi:MAG TPA: hypothetical protein VEY31_05025 [Roseococcus sp.]|nr:hypothetical protein [Roseococcus sp.]